MSDTLVSVTSAVASTLCYALAAISQEKAAARTDATEEQLSALRRAVRAGSLWRGVALNSLGGVLHVVALRFGSLTMVQLIGTLTLVLVLPLRALLGGEAIRPAERRGAALTSIGLVGLFLTTEPAPVVETLTRPELRLVIGLCLFSIVALTLAAPSRKGGAFRYAAASGIAFAGASVLSQTLAVDLTDRQNLPGFYILVSIAATALLSVAGLVLIQAAYRSGGLGVPLAVQTITNPTVAAAVGLLLLGEHFRGRLLGLLCALVAGAVVTRGILLLSRHSESTAVAPSPTCADPARL
ncbi:hypothetical protein AMK27_36220 [Streptomyces sp. CB02009]|uniref:DMT family transporter n=1 Tax=Streptomyces sp. CB02009 TaxID=1703938 RepID=UPI0009395080|nr:DMT family transporter [Streptomyces sp. CB02009]OKJ49513.1 hypothetical protein AMK27_36220 [Streptomyces sp. CB02009]